MLKSKSMLNPKQDWILDDKNTSLRIICKKVVLPLSFIDQQYVDKMVAYIDACANGLSEKYGLYEGIAIAAPQVGCDKQIIYTNFIYEDKIYNYLLANPKIINHSLQKCYLEAGESCLSVKTKYNGKIVRWYHIVVEAYDMKTQKQILIDLKGLPAICFQHEIDHLNGVFFYDNIGKEPLISKKDNLISI